MVTRAVGGAHYGVRDWLVQRVSALVIALYGAVLLALLLTHRPLQYAVWRGWFEQPAMRVFSLLFALSVLAHAWVGMRDILMDYVRATGMRLAMQVVTLLALLAYAIWAAMLLWRLP